MDKCLDLVWAADENYVFLAGVSMTSVFENNADIEELRVWFLADNISKQSRERLEACAEKYHREIHIIDVDKELKEIADTGAGRWGEKQSYCAYARLYLQKLLQPYNVERAIYCDCDLIIDGSLEEILLWDLQGKAIGLVKDYNRVEIRTLLELPMDAAYYNTGFMLIDLATWEAKRCTERIIEHMRTVQAMYPFVDQDLINCVLHNEISTLPMRYNVNPRVMLYTYKNLCTAYGMNEKNYYSKIEYNEVRKNKPVVYHCSDPAAGRPWENGNHHIYSPIWNEYFQKSLWDGVYIKRSYTANRNSMIQQILSKIVPQCIYVRILRHGARKSMIRIVNVFQMYNFDKTSSHLE